ncbi:MAG: hypothetical protein ILM98_03535 [Kiritimatiellae bacterium]|nr:hypothetical protein [Kiritimatiellia bacterium]
MSSTCRDASFSGGAGSILGLPADVLYFKWQAADAATRRDIRRFAAGAIDPDLPVPVEDCLLHCAIRDGGIAIFAIGKEALAEAVRAHSQRTGAPCDCAVPMPLAIWNYASGEVLGRGGAKALLLLDASPNGWTLCAGRATSKNAPLEAVMSLSTGDAAGAARAARILVGRLGGTATLAVTGRDAPDTLLKSVADAAQSESTIDLRCEGPSQEELLQRYVRQRYFSSDSPIEEAEGAAFKRRRARAALLPAAFLSIAAAILAVSSIAFDLAAGGVLRKTDLAIDSAATRLAGAPMRLHGPAAVAAATRSFDERAEPCVARTLSLPPRVPLREVLSFAETRSISILGIDCDGSSISFALRPENEGDIAALSAALAHSGLAASHERREDGSFTLSVPLEDGR